MPLILPVPLGFWFWMREYVKVGARAMLLRLALAEPVTPPARLFQIRQFLKIGILVLL